MNLRSSFYLFSCTNILIINFIAKGTVAGDPQTEISEGSSQGTNAERTEFQDEDDSSEVSLKNLLDDPSTNPAQNKLVEEIYRRWNQEDGRKGTWCYFDGETKVDDDDFIKSLNKNTEEYFKGWSNKRKLYLCRRIWTVLLFQLNSSQIHEIENYEKLFSVKSIENDPILKNRTILYGYRKQATKLTVLGCRLQHKKETTEPFDVYILPHQTPNWYYASRTYIPPQSELVHIIVCLIRDVSYPETKFTCPGFCFRKPHSD